VSNGDRQTHLLKYNSGVSKAPHSLPTQLTQNPIANVSLHVICGARKHFVDPFVLIFKKHIIKQYYDKK